MAVSYFSQLATAYPLLVLALFSRLAQGQTPPLYPAPGMTPFAIALVDSIKYEGADAVIIRRANATPHDVIAVRKQHAKAKWLAEAVHTLAVVRALHGDSPTADAVYRVKEPGPPRKREAEAEYWSKRLQSNRPLPLEGFGESRYMILYLPNQRK